MSDELKVFEVLNNVDMWPFAEDKHGKKIERKNTNSKNLAFIPWSRAWRELCKVYPDADYEFTNFNGFPFLETPLGFFVECSVTINGKCRKLSLPVFGNNNQAIKTPTAMDINKSSMRCLVKVIAMHGLGLDMWAGEDLNDGYESDGSVKIEPTISNEQVNQLCELLLEQDGTLNKKGCKIAKAYKLNGFDEIKEKDFNKILEVARK